MKWRKRETVEEQIERSNEVLRQMAEIVIQLQTNTDRLEECLEQMQEDERQ